MGTLKMIVRKISDLTLANVSGDQYLLVEKALEYEGKKITVDDLVSYIASHHSHRTFSQLESGSGTTGGVNLSTGYLYLLNFTLDNSWYEHILVITCNTNVMTSITIGRNQNYYWRLCFWGDWSGAYLQKSTDGVTWDNESKPLTWYRLKIS